MSGRWRIVLTPLVILFCAACLCYALRPTPHVLRVGIFVGSPWGVPGGDIYGMLDESIAAFEEAHPGVQVTYVSGISRDAYSEWLAERFLAGDEPDVFLLLPEDFELYAAQGALLPLAPLEKDDAAFDASAFYPAAFAYGQYDGESMALPLACMTRLMFVNKTLLAREGIAMPEGRWTFDDFYRIAAAVTRDTDGDGTLDQFGVYDYDWQLAATATGAQLFRDDGRASYFAAPEVEQAVRFCMKLSALTRGHQVTPRDFDLGRVAFRPFSSASRSPSSQAARRTPRSASCSRASPRARTKKRSPGHSCGTSRRATNRRRASSRIRRAFPPSAASSKPPRPPMSSAKASRLRSRPRSSAKRSTMPLRLRNSSATKAPCCLQIPRSQSSSTAPSRLTTPSTDCRKKLMRTCRDDKKLHDMHILRAVGSFSDGGLAYVHDASRAFGMWQDEAISILYAAATSYQGKTVSEDVSPDLQERPSSVHRDSRCCFSAREFQASNGNPDRHPSMAIL